MLSFGVILLMVFLLFFESFSSIPACDGERESWVLDLRCDKRSAFSELLFVDGCCFCGIIATMWFSVHCGFFLVAFYVLGGLLSF